MKSYYVHLKNKYPKANVELSESSLSVREDGELIVMMKKNCHGQMVDAGEEYGARDAFDLSPIPKESRLFKLDKDGKIKKDELYDERKPESYKLVEKYNKIPSSKELADKGEYNLREDKLIIK